MQSDIQKMNFIYGVAMSAEVPTKIGNRGKKEVINLLKLTNSRIVQWVKSLEMN